MQGPGAVPAFWWWSGGGDDDDDEPAASSDDDGGFSFTDWASDTWAEITSGGEAVTQTYNPTNTSVDFTTIDTNTGNSNQRSHRLTMGQRR